ncbi:putative helicase mov-10-B.1 [Pseudolycoriella hygida]|uniref:Helicase mov-10-B.1 n=1 Tax=Pseudolycoriella hygida TaxID=35572 RepID=A0A9Q0MV45_9DIPT|nr:putative helicase mov-10-B.1 [Pseudolycoriella hygida]
MSVISSANSDQETIEITTPTSTGAFFRFIAKKFKPTAHCCHICRYNFKFSDDLNNHLKVHRSKIVLRMSSLTESTFLHALSISCKLAMANDESSDLIVSITNISQLDNLKICHIYFSSGNFVNYWKSDILPFVLPIGAKEVDELIYNLAKKLPFLMENDRIWISPCKTKSKQERVYGNVIDVQSDAFYFRLERGNYLDKFGSSKLTFRLHFLANRLNFQMEQCAVERVRTYQLSDYLFPKLSQFLSLKSTNILSYFNKDILSNAEQMQAVENITSGTAFPAPYLIFGPPGTGKTNTIVEAILQIWKTQPYSRILVCATSNSACDEIAQRILKYIPSHHKATKTYNLYRLYAASINKDLPVESVLNSSNFFDKFYPPLETLYQYRIIVGTLGVAGRLAQARFRSDFFTHLFIDECGSATESASLIPIAGICSSVGRLNVHVVLSGDPLQLGPILSSRTAEALGLGRSMIERLMDIDIYKKDPITNKYNSKVLTKLIINYRSHPSIIQISNKMFYDNELIPRARKEITDICLGWKLLPAINFPMIFDAAAGEAEQETNCTSWYNKVEINRVMFYLDELLNVGVNGIKFSQTDVGIISPYKKQCTLIEEACCKRGWRDFMVSSVEQFQGKEKQVIIVSTVRSKSDNIGFLNNFRRLNVLLSRAQALLIIIGDPKTLRIDENWNTVINIFEQNNAIISSNDMSEPKTAELMSVDSLALNKVLT